MGTSKEVQTIYFLTILNMVTVFKIFESAKSTFVVYSIIEQTEEKKASLYILSTKCDLSLKGVEKIHNVLKMFWSYENAKDIIGAKTKYLDEELFASIKAM